MQVNSIQSSPNFGMALRVTPAAREALEKKSVEALDHIKQVGTDVLAKHKHVDVVLEEGARPVVKTRFANAYKDYFRPEKPYYEYLNVKTRWAGTELAEGPKVGDAYTAVYDLGTNDAALDAYRKISEAETEFDKAVEFANLIEKRGNLQDAANAAEKAKLEAQKAKTDGLFEQFGEFEGF